MLLTETWFDKDGVSLYIREMRHFYIILCIKGGDDKYFGMKRKKNLRWML